MSSIRLFCAVDLPEDVIDDLSAMAYGVPGARWRNADQLHLTLRFIGEVDGVGFSDVVHTLQRIRQAPFSLSLSGMGHFPPKGQPRVLWAGVAGSEPLMKLRKVVDGALVRLGTEVDRRRYVPHVTLARLDGTSSSRLGRFLAGHALYRSREFPVDAFHLYSSELHPKGAVYQREQTFELSA